MADFTVRQGDDFTIADTLKDAAGAAVNIQGAAIKLTLIPLAGGAALLNAVVATNDQVGDGTGDGSKGKVHYTGAGALTAAAAGFYLGTWLATFAGPASISYPNGGYILFEVTADAPVTADTRFAESVDLEARLGLTFTADEHLRAQQLLAWASGLIQLETKQTVSLVAGDTLTRPGDYSSRIRLPQRPVVSIASVTVDGVAQTLGTDFYLDGDELVRIGPLPDSSFGLPGSGWGYPWKNIVIVYTHGYAVVPKLVKAIAMEMVVRVWVNPGSVIQESIAGVQTAYAPYSAPPRGLLLTDDEKNALNKLLRYNTSGTITLR